MSVISPRQGSTTTSQGRDYHEHMFCGAARLTSYLRIDHVEELVRIRGSELNFQEIKLLVGIDGTKTMSCVCANCKTRFTPVFWYDITTPAFLEHLSRKPALGEALWECRETIQKLGCFFPNGASGHLPYCGAPWVYDREQETYSEAKSCYNIAKAQAGAMGHANPEQQSSQSNLMSQKILDQQRAARFRRATRKV